MSLPFRIYHLKLPDIGKRAGRARERLRRARLAAASAHPDFQKRLPHRAIELACLRKQRLGDLGVRRFRRSLRDILSPLAPGTVIVANYGPTDDEGVAPPFPVPTDVPFEPADLNSGDGPNLVEVNLRAQGLSIDDWMNSLGDKVPPLEMYARRNPSATSKPPEYSDTRKRASQKQGGLALLRRVCGAVGRVVGLLILFGLMLSPVLVIAGLFYWNPQSGFLCVSIGVVLLGLLSMVTLIAGRHWWAVPGGIVRVDHRLWRSQRDVRVYRSANTPLFVDYGESKGYVLFRGRLATIPASWTLLAAWLSTARSPTDEEILAFVGPDARLA
ncbi:MAG: hypothetical protein JXB13_03305 [Phycisphaerae bacterium]|nr:hypothetical protein [Phycisphaerae bacterium]